VFLTCQNRDLKCNRIWKLPVSSSCLGTFLWSLFFFFKLTILYYLVTIYVKSFGGENFHGFHGFLLTMMFHHWKSTLNIGACHYLHRPWYQLVSSSQVIVIRRPALPYSVWWLLWHSNWSHCVWKVTLAHHPPHPPHPICPPTHPLICGTCDILCHIWKKLWKTSKSK